MESPEELKSMLADVCDIAVHAGTCILEIYGSAFSVSTKADESPLTAADLASHETIQRSLTKLTPGIPVLSEESAALPVAERWAWRRFWLVDPLDGTREFINRNGEFTVNIALVENGVPVLGVVHVPVTSVTYAAAVGVAATRIDAEGEKAIQVALQAPSPFRVVGSRSHLNDETLAYLEDLGEHSMVSIGSSLKFCVVAEGAADVYPRLGPTSEWDTAAAQCVVECAGGRVVDLEGNPLRYNQRESLLNPYFLVYGDPSRDWLPKSKAKHANG